MPKVYYAAIYGSPVRFFATKREAGHVLSELLMVDASAQGSIEVIEYQPTRQGIADLLNRYGEKQ